MDDVIRLDRHVLASPATAYDTAWTTYGVTPGARSRAGRLEEEVPWGTHVTRAADPARLSGPVDAVLDPSNLDRLGQAVLPVGEWIAFALWGAFGADGEGRDRRVLTHTLLLSETAFRRIRGHPGGLLRPGGRPASWLRELAESSEFREPATLEPAVFPADPKAGATWSVARLEELGRLRSVVLAGLGGDARALGERLARLYEALARSRKGEGPRHLVVRGVGAPTSCLLRLTWLSLPLEDRVRVAFVTEQRRSERPRAQLLGLPEAEWGRYVPEGSWVLDEDEPFPPTAGRILWAERVASPDFPAGFRRLDARAELRGWSLVEGDDLDAEALRARWRAGWCDRGPSLDGVERLWAVESRRPGGPRSGAVGVALGRAVSPDGDEEPREGAVRRATDVVAGLPAVARVPVLRGAVRTLGRGGPEGRIRGGLLRCRTAAAHPETAGELARLLDRESGALRALLSGAGGPGGIELVLGAAPGAAAGDPMARELVRLGALETRWTAADARELARRLAEVDGRRGVVRDVLEALVHDPARHEALGTAARSLVPLLAVEAVSSLAEELMGGPSRGTALGAAGFPVLEALAEAGTADERAGPLVATLAGVRPPEAEPEPWRALVAEAPASWLSGATVLGAWVRALDAGRRPFGDGVGAPIVAAGVVRRVLERPWPTGLGEGRSRSVLRLLWAAGTDRPLDGLCGREDEIPVLADLLVLPAPVPLFHRIRTRLVAATRARGAAGPPEPVRVDLARWAPALASGVAPPRGSLVFLGRGG